MCGIAFVRDLTGRRNVVPDALTMASALYNRGQHGTGIAVALEEFPRIVVPGKNAIDEIRRSISTLMGTTAFAHNRYQTSGSADCNEYNQPFFIDSSAFIFNGNITNHVTIAESLRAKGVELTSDIDTEVLFKYILYTIQREQMTIREVLKVLEKTFDGAYSLGVIADDGDAWFYRSAKGIRPLCYGNSQGKVMVASESIALEQVDQYVIPQDLEPGSLLTVTADGLVVERIVESNRATCYKEWVYFADARTTIDDVNVKRARYESGKMLASTEENLDLEAIVCAVPRTAILFARGFSDGTGLHMKDVVFKKEAQRTFIAPNSDREQDIIDTYYFDVDKIKGSSIYLCDDSIIRGPTMKFLVKRLKDLGAKAVHIRIASPPVTAPCFYGINFPTSSELFAHAHMPGPLLEDELPPEVLQRMAAALGADSLRYTPVSVIKKIIDPQGKGLCMACVSGQYPTPEGQRLYAIETAGHK